ncbi:MAG: hypothetical protein ACTS5V_01645 [Giesbergeria sp.]
MFCMRLTFIPSLRLPIALALLSLLGACDIPGLGPDPRIAQREEEAKAIGGACRYALRGIEDCYANNPKSSKAAIFTGWKDMDGYMRENKIEGIAAEGSAAGDEPEEAPTPAPDASAAAKK